MSTKWLLYGADDNGGGYPEEFDTEEDLMTYLEDKAEDIVNNILYLCVEKVTVEKAYTLKVGFKLQEELPAKGDKK